VTVTITDFFITFKEMKTLPQGQAIGPAT